MQTIEIFNIIFDKVMPVTSFASTLLLAQILNSSYTETMFFYKTIKNKSEMLSIFLAVIPSLLIITYAIVSPFLYSGLVNGGLADKYVEMIINLTITKKFYIELVILLLIFAILVFIYQKKYKLSNNQLFRSYSFETFMGIALLLVYSMWYFTQNPDFIQRLTITRFTYLLYGYFSIIYKILLLSVGLIMAVIFNDKKVANYEKIVADRDESIRKACLKYLNYRKVLTSLTVFTTFAGMLSIILVAGLNEKGYSYENLIITCKEISFVLVMCGFLFIVSFIGIFFAIFPKTSPAYRRLKKAGKFKEFYEEVVQNKLDHKMIDETESFTISHFFYMTILTIKK